MAKYKVKEESFQGQTFYLFKTKPDGNCLLEAVSVACQYLDNVPEYVKNLSNLREKVADSIKDDIEQNKEDDDYKHTIQSAISSHRRPNEDQIPETISEDEKLAMYLTDIKEDGVFNDAPSIKALNNLLDIHIVVHQRGEDTPHHTLDETAEKQKIHLLYSGSGGGASGHYDLLIDHDLKEKMRDDIELISDGNQKTSSKNEQKLAHSTEPAPAGSEASCVGSAPFMNTSVEADNPSLVVDQKDADEMVKGYQMRVALESDPENNTGEGVINEKPSNSENTYPIQEIDFSDDDEITRDTVLGRMAKWEDIPQFAIITGANGSGKSKLLEFINNNKNTYRLTDKEVLYLKGNEVMQFTSSPGGNNLNLSDDERKKIYNLVRVELELEEADSSTYLNNREEVKEIAAGVVEHIKGKIEEGNITTEKLDYTYVLPIIREKEYSSKKQDILYALVYLQRLCNQEAYNLQQMSVTIIDLFEFCKSAANDPVVKKIFDDYGLKVETDADNFIKIIDEYIDKLSDMYRYHRRCIIEKEGRTIIQEINEILRANKFKYFLEMISGQGNINFVMKSIDRGSHENDNGFSPLYLSTGEQMLLTIVVWQYHSLGGNLKGTIRRFDNKVKLMLLDEPDRHLDPDLCKVLHKVINEVYLKNGIQVIMTTHRTDMVSLAEPGSVYFINQRNKSIERTTRIEALFRMTKNTRHLSQIPVKVYVEAHDDARFFAGIKYRIDELNEEVRENNISEGKKSTFWDVERIGQHKRVLSRRYPMIFVSTADHETNGGGGGRKSVDNLVNKDLGGREIIIEDLQLKGDSVSTLKLDNAQVSKPFGLIDLDYGYYNFKNNNKKYTERFLKLKRHSLENYIYDPFIIIGTGMEEDIKDKKLKQNCNELRDAVLGYSGDVKEIQNKLDEYFYNLMFLYFKSEVSTYKEEEIKKKDFNFKHYEKLIEKEKDKTKQKQIKEDCHSKAIEIAEKIKEMVENDKFLDRDKCLESLVNEFTELSKADMNSFNMLCDIVKPEQLKYSKQLKEWKNKKEKNIDVLEKQKIYVLLNEGSVIEVQYPKLFLFYRGHDIGVKEKEATGFAKHGKRIFEEDVVTNTLKCQFIPCDLIETILEINCKIISQAVEVHKERRELHYSDTKKEDILQNPNLQVLLNEYWKRDKNLNDRAPLRISNITDFLDFRKFLLNAGIPRGAIDTAGKGNKIIIKIELLDGVKDKIVNLEERYKKDWQPMYLK